MAKLGWVNQHFLKTEDVAAIVPHLVTTSCKLGLDGVAAGPAPEDVVIALRERVQTLKEMAEKAVVWYQPLTEYDDAAVAGTSRPVRVALGKARELLAALPNGPPNRWAWPCMTRPQRWRSAWARWPAVARGHHRYQVSPDISIPCTWLAASRRLKRIDVAITKAATA